MKLPAKPFDMKLMIRSVILAGVLVLLILVFSTQPAQAGQASTVFRVPNYAGHITLEPLYIFSFDQSGSSVRQILTWNNQGTLSIMFYGNAGDYAVIRFGSWQILITDIDTVPNGSTSLILSASAAANLLRSSSVDPKEPSFTIPFQVNKISYSGPVCSSSFSRACSMVYWNALKMAAEELSRDLTTIKLSVYINTGDKLGGSCSLPGWDQTTAPNSTYSENCMWTAHCTDGNCDNGNKPEWTTKK